MDISELKKRVAQIIDERADEIIAIGESILAKPEMGYRELNTSALVRAKLDELSIPYRDGLAVTGVKEEITDALVGSLGVVLIKHQVVPELAVISVYSEGDLITLITAVEGALHNISDANAVVADRNNLKILFCVHAGVKIPSCHFYISSVLKLFI